MKQFCVNNYTDFWSIKNIKNTQREIKKQLMNNLNFVTDINK